MQGRGGGEAACGEPQRLTGKYEGPKRGKNIGRPCGTCPDGSSTTLLTNTEVPGGGELYVENVERGGGYIGTGRLHIRDDMKILIHGRHKGTKNAC